MKYDGLLYEINIILQDFWQDWGELAQNHNSLP